MRNLKQSYRSLKDNNKKNSTERGAISWEWYEIIEDIFREDETINIDATLSSMTFPEKKENTQSTTLSTSSTVLCEVQETTSTSTTSTSTSDSEIINFIGNKSPTKCV